MDTILTKEEEILVGKFRERLSDILDKEEYKSEHYLVRWIRARDHNLDKAEEMLRNSLKWRKENDVDSLFDRGVEDFFTEAYPFEIEGHDREGRPIVYCNFGFWDVRKAVDAGKIDGMVEYFEYFCESVLNAVRKAKSADPKKCPVTKAFYIVDCKDYAFSQVVNFKVIQGMMAMAKSLEGHYPEIVFKGVIFNAPRAFHIMFGLLKPFMPPRTVDHLLVLGSKTEEWQSEIEKYVDQSQLRPEYGGTRGMSENEP